MLLAVAGHVEIGHRRRLLRQLDTIAVEIKNDWFVVIVIVVVVIIIAQVTINIREIAVIIV
ncbi:hypothetical protein [Rhizobium leguminosarum]|uniref:Uncharacterized protein n=1 Tax=Rhizobium leguminosarum TaxID=384 RepID=A0A7K3VQ17_RHILE|nr:hypothetical protein [Rhizobium leguminosarum]NEK18974.1 hypothetical protein [Rhizobium leguminosarum]